MKSIKKMLLGIAFLIIAAIGCPIWMAGSYVGVALFFSGFIVGVPLCLVGFFEKNE